MNFLPKLKTQALAEAAGVRLEILTGRDKGRDRAAKLADLASGDIGILVGTHAVFQKDVVFADLRLAVIDEQHRFGVAQRMELGAKTKSKEKGEKSTPSKGDSGAEGDSGEKSAASS